MQPDRWLKPPLFVAALLPAVWLLYGAFVGTLGANPVETLTHQTGTTALVILLITLAVTPLRRFTGWLWLTRLRRMAGLYAFFYAVLHFSTWLVFDHFFDWNEITKDIVKRPYITVGFSAFCLLLPLAVTSTNKMMRRLGGQRWKRLHSLVYVIGTLAVLHFLWLVKADTREPIIYACVLIALLVARLPARAAKPKPAARRATTVS
jgi:sulfoxide reductase heme-binding subunit YedZ